MHDATLEKSGHIEFLHETLSLLLTLKSHASYMIGWKSLLQLWDDLCKVNEVKLFHTRRLNQDCVANHFSVIGGKGGHGDNPSPRQFQFFLCQVIVSSCSMKEATALKREITLSWHLAASVFRALQQFLKWRCKISQLAFNISAEKLYQFLKTIFHLHCWVCRQKRYKGKCVQSVKKLLQESKKKLQERPFVNQGGTLR